MPAASILIKPASANCNMDCRYCFYKCLSSNREEYSKGFMSEDILEKLVTRAIDYAEGSLTFAFQGGEPTLCGVDFFQRAVDLQRKHNDKGLNIVNTLQTNGMLLDERWADFLSRNHFLVGLSLDGPKKCHDKYRVGIQGEGSFDRVMQTVRMLNRYHVDYNILSVVTNDAAEKSSGIYRFFRRQKFPFLQFIPCMDEANRFERQASSPYAIEPEKYGRFLCELFDMWYEDYCGGADIDIRMFSNLAQMAAGYPSEECGMSGCCDCYFVVEGDGSVYPCDFYCSDQWKLGTVADSFQDLLVSPRAKRFIEESKYQQEKCAACPYLSLCHGGCRRWRENAGGEGLGLNRLCPAYEVFFAHTGERIERLGQLILQRYGAYTKS